MFTTIGFIGTGNMGAAVAKAVSASVSGTLLLTNRTPAKAQALAGALPNAAVVSNTEAAQRSDLLFLCVKPHIVPDVLEEIKDVLAARKDRFVICSMATAGTCARIRELVGDYPVIRIMPNTPTAVGCGVTEYCSVGVTDAELAQFRTLMAAAGILDPLDESLMDAASAVSGCGPAYAYLFAEALADGGVACGLPRAKAQLYAAGMLEGAAKMLRESGCHSGQLKDAVCSPGGSTIQGVRALEEAGFRGAVMDAVIAAYEKTIRMK